MHFVLGFLTRAFPVPPDPAKNDSLRHPEEKSSGCFFLLPALDSRSLLDYSDLMCGCARAYTSSRARDRGPSPCPADGHIFSEAAMKTAVLGFGTVGVGVYEMLNQARGLERARWPGS